MARQPTASKAKIERLLKSCDSWRNIPVTLIDLIVSQTAWSERVSPTSPVEQGTCNLSRSATTTVAGSQINTKEYSITELLPSFALLGRRFGRALVLCDWLESRV